MDDSPAGSEGPGAQWDFLGSRVAIVSRFSPAQDGIARYADALATALAREREVLRVGTPEGGGDRLVDLQGGARAFRLLSQGRGFDDVLVMWHPHYFVRHFLPQDLLSRLVSYVSWAVVALRRPLTFVVHETDDPRPVEIGRRGKAAFWLEERVRRFLWARAKGLVFHSQWERREFNRRFPAIGRRREYVVSPGALYESVVECSQAQARMRLGLSPDRVVLLCIGFLSPEKPDKGYDRAIRAVGHASLDHVDLHIVGSPIRRRPDVDRYVAGLRELVQDAPNVHLHERFVGDDEFDLWLRAADAVLAPYRTGSSSAVVERAHLAGTTVVTSGVGGIAEQLRGGDILFSTEEELVDAIRNIAARPQPA